MPHNDNLREIYQDLRKSFADNAIACPDLDARLIIQAATGLDHAGMILAFDRQLTEQEISAIKVMSKRRLLREPISRILGKREFYGRNFIVTADVLDPRPDTETLINQALAVIDHKSNPTILDIGTGSGAIIVSLLCELPLATGVATDLSAPALEVARRNAVRLGVDDRLDLIETSWCAKVRQTFDVVVSNPPYISSSDIEKLAPDVKNFDPHLALDGGTDGLDAYRQIAALCLTRLSLDGLLLLEIGFDQADAVVDIFTAAGFQPYRAKELISKDLGGNNRVITMTPPGSKKGLENLS